MINLSTKLNNLLISCRYFVKLKKIKVGGLLLKSHEPHYLALYKKLYPKYDEILPNLVTFLDSPEWVVDIGANIGCICLPLAKHVGDRGCVLSFEADPAVFQKLQDNFSLNSFPQWRGFNEALGSSPGTLTFHRAASSGSFGNAIGSLYANDWHAGGSTFEVSIDTLDRVLGRDQINRVDVIKIDVEGAEMDVLRGSLQTIEKYRPILCLEVCEHTYTSAGWTPQDLFDLLTPFGYSFEALDERNPGQTRPLRGPHDRDYLTLVARVL
jgi:FkbM family methyltransferase